MLWDYLYYSSIELRLELASVVAEKVNDICLYCTADVDFHVRLEEHDGCGVVKMPEPWHWESQIHLSQRSCYRHKFSEKFVVSNWDNQITVSVTVKLVMLRYTLNIIDEVKVPPPALGNELGGLLTFEMGEKKNKFTDITFSVTTSELMFYAHKAVLAARSPVFAKMFEHSLQESITNCVTVTDINPEVFKELLTYIYTGQAPNIQTLASSLLNPAEKYQLGRLKALCERQMSYGLQVENAAETLVLAHTYGADHLKRNALRFIIKHRGEVRETKEWENVHESCQLLEELLDTALELATKSESIPELLQKFPKI